MGVSYSGIVKEGKGRAQVLGYPTANISLPDADSSGIFVAQVLVNGNMYTAAAFADQKRKLLEAHLLDFSGNLNGKEVTITLVQKIRDGANFADDRELIAAIAADVLKAREYFSK